MFEIVEVETINFCNNDCSFCPANYKFDKRKHAFMPDHLISKIIYELSEMEYGGQVNLFSQGEPLLDPRMVDIVAKFRQALPQVKLTLYTNCLSLSIRTFEKIITNIDHMVLNMYHPLPSHVSTTVSKCIEYANRMNLLDRLEIRQRNKDDVLTTKGGLAPNKKSMDKQPNSCILPFRQLVIKATGNIVLCCNDVFENHIIGNIYEEKLQTIWESDLYAQYRKLILEGRDRIDICSQCDVDWQKQRGLSRITPLSNEEINMNI